MKNYLYLLIILSFPVLVFSSCVHYSSHNTKVTVTESDRLYVFSASFPDDKTSQVHRVVNKSMSPNGLFASVNDYLNVTTTLQDKTAFAVKASPGEIRITIDRQGNSPASYNRVKVMCAAIKDALKD